MVRIPTLVICGSLLAATPALATTVVAVLPVRGASFGRPAVAEREQVETAIRAAAATSLSQTATVMPEEATRRLVAPDDDCDDGCGLWAARRLGSDLYVATSLTRSRLGYSSFVAVRKTTTGQLVFGTRFDAPDLAALLSQFRDSSATFFASVLSNATTPKGRVLQEEALLPMKFNADSMTEHWSLLSSDRIVCQFPCSHNLSLSHQYALSFDGANAMPLEVQMPPGYRPGEPVRVFATSPQGHRDLGRRLLIAGGIGTGAGLTVTFVAMYANAAASIASVGPALFTHNYVAPNQAPYLAAERTGLGVAGVALGTLITGVIVMALSRDAGYVITAAQ